jgi:hypothetical protein
VWLGDRELVGVVVDHDGARVIASRIPDDEPGEALNWLARAEYEVGPGLELVVSSCTVRHLDLAAHALLLEPRVWVAPRNIVLAVCRAAWWRPTPRQIATVLARMPYSRHLRACLRLQPRISYRQLRLF